jgi:RHS repeat-associated protein
MSSPTAELYTYDVLNQLRTASLSEGPQSVTYDGFGRILTKSGVNGVSGNYGYEGSSLNGSTTSNRVNFVNGRSYEYDSRGNVRSINNSITLSWTSFNQPMTLPVAASNESTVTVASDPDCNNLAAICLRYGADHERRLELLPADSSRGAAGSQPVSRYVLHSGAAMFYEEDVRPNAGAEQRVFITGPLGVVAVLATSVDANQQPVTTGNAFTLSYWHRDHLGSVTVTTDAAGAVVNRSSYDPWGKPRASFPLGDRSRTGDRGFTGHEHLAGGLIHMNGRIYDPVLGRFLSADIVVQFPDAITSYNRYAYVLNNPLAYTDPSGYFIPFIAALIAKYGFVAVVMTAATAASAIAMATGNEKLGMRIFFAGVFIASGGGIGGGFLNAITGGFAFGGLQSGSIEGAISGAVQAGLTFGVGSFADALSGAAALGDIAKIFEHGGIGRAGMHGTLGCMMAVSNGGKCGPAAAAAGFSEIAGGALPKDNALLRFAGKAVIGGTAAYIGGGKFGNGAMTAAFTHLYNECQHTQMCGGDGGYSPFDKKLDPRVVGPGSPSASGALEGVHPEWVGLAVVGSFSFGAGVAAQSMSMASADALVTVTSWAARGVIPELNAGRWVMMGNSNWMSYIATGLPGGQFLANGSIWSSANTTISNHVTWTVPASRLAWPAGWEAFKGVLGQRVLKP